jgi:hypothetical protein
MQQQDIDLITADQRIDWILRHPDMSPWLKTTLRTARQRDPVVVANDLELLNCTLRPWCEMAMQAAAVPLDAAAGRDEAAVEEARRR